LIQPNLRLANGELGGVHADRNAARAGPYQAIPQSGQSWQGQGQPATVPHEYVRGGTTKLLTLFEPATGLLCAKGVTHAPNAVLRPWLVAELEQVLAKHERAGRCAELQPQLEAQLNRAAWEAWQADLTIKFTLPDRLPALRALLIVDNLAGHKTPAFVLQILALGVMPLYTPLGGSWLNRAESIQRIIVRRALAGTHMQSSEQTLAALDATVRGWNRCPTPFVWGGKRLARRCERRLGGSGAVARRSLFQSQITH